MDLHIFFLPFLAPGHMIPMVDLAKLFADRGAAATIVTTAGNLPRIQPTVDDLANSQPSRRRHPLRLLPLRFPSAASGLPDGSENLTDFPSPEVTPEFFAAISMLEAPFKQLLQDHRPDCVVSDIFYPWTAGLARDFGIPRLAFHGTSFFTVVLTMAIGSLKPHESVESDAQPFVVPGLPHRIELTRSQLPGFVTAPSDYLQRMRDAQRLSSGTVMNSFRDMELDYADQLKNAGVKVWLVGPVSLVDRDTDCKEVRGGQASTDCSSCLGWLDGKKPGSVLYVCFGSLGRFTPAQLREIASGLEASGHPFVWLVGRGREWLPEGFEKRVVSEGKGVVIGGWAPQLVLLSHRAVGGFVTHCGWNSCLEGGSAGLPMLAWPLFAEQFFNEKLIVDVLRVGSRVGAKVCSEREEEREVVEAEVVKEAVRELMGDGEESQGRRKRARELGEKAKRAMEKGGSSYVDMSRLIEDLITVKAAGVNNVR